MVAKGIAVHVVLCGFSFYCLPGRKSVVVYFKSTNKCANIPTGGSEEVRGNNITNVYVFVCLHIFERNKHTPDGEFQKEDNYKTLPFH